MKIEVPISDLPENLMIRARHAGVVIPAQVGGEDSVYMNGTTLDTGQEARQVIYFRDFVGVWAVKSSLGWLVIHDTQSPREQDAGDLGDWPSVIEAARKAKLGLDVNAVILIGEDVKAIENTVEIGDSFVDVSWLRHLMNTAKLTAVWLWNHSREEK